MAPLTFFIVFKYIDGIEMNLILCFALFQAQGYDFEYDDFHRYQILYLS